MMDGEIEVDSVADSLLTLVLNRDANLRSKFGMLLAEAEQPEVVLQQIKLIDLVSVETESSAERQAELAELLRKGVDTSASDYLGKLRSFQRRYPKVDLDAVWGRPHCGFPLHLAVMQNLPQVLGILLTAPQVNMEEVDKDGMTATHQAAHRGAVECLEKLLEAGVDSNAKVPGSAQDRFPNRVAGFTPLHMAVLEGQVQCVTVLLGHGVDHNATNALGETCLYLAAKLGHPDIVMTLFNKAYGAPVVSYPTHDDDTPLHACLRSGEKMGECVRELVRRKADVIWPNSKGQCPLHLAVNHQWSMGIIELLIFRGNNMDFDRLQRSAILSRCHCTVAHHDNPLNDLITDWCGCPRGASYTLPYITETLPKLAILFLQAGATTRHYVEYLMFCMLTFNSVNPEDPHLSTLMDCYAYLPPLSKVLAVAPMWRNTEKEKEKLRLYHERQREVPTLAHLSRCSVRCTLRVCNVEQLPVPISVKEYILLGRKLPPPLKVE